MLKKDFKVEKKMDVHYTQILQNAEGISASVGPSICPAAHPSISLSKALEWLAEKGSDGWTNEQMYRPFESTAQ